MKKFGFGCMRLPMVDGQVDIPQFTQMVDRFLEEGFTYFDTAHGYLGGRSETALRECLTSRYPREAYQLTDKLTASFFRQASDIRPFFESQLAACGVEYFDYYLMHAQNTRLYERFLHRDAYHIASQLKAEGKIRHVGISFHDKAEVLERILTEQPQLEVVQIQFNYLDYEDPEVESRKCLEVCRRHGKPVIVMEPVKGGNLANLPAEAGKYLDALGGGSYSSYAIRYAASFEGVMMVLSGMSDLAQMEDNLSFMKDFRPLDRTEYAALEQVANYYRSLDLISCTACRYCIDGCPRQINIPALFSCTNMRRRFPDWDGSFTYTMRIQNAGKASDCIQCGRCEDICPQHLPIRTLLNETAQIFEAL